MMACKLLIVRLSHRVVSHKEHDEKISLRPLWLKNNYQLNKKSNPLVVKDFRLKN